MGLFKEPERINVGRVMAGDPQSPPAKASIFAPKLGSNNETKNTFIKSPKQKDKAETKDEATDSCPKP